MWASRVWWLLRSFGFDDVAVLDGGFARWEAEGRPVTAEPDGPAPAATFTVRDRPGLVADRDKVLAVVHDGGASLVNALGAEDFAATSTDRYPRPGRIPAASTSRPWRCWTTAAASCRSRRSAPGSPTCSPDRGAR